MNKENCKIPDGAVVISKDEYDELKHRPSTREWVEACGERIEQARKETAKCILDEVSKHFGGRWLSDLYDKYGVEVEE